MERYRLGPYLYVKWGCMVVFRGYDKQADDLYEFGPCQRPLPPGGSAADLLLRRYLGDPTEEEEEAWWDKRHIEVGRSFATEALAIAHDKAERRRQ